MTPSRDEGSGTVLTLAVVVLVMVVTAASAALFQVAAARHRAQAAADLSALAAAQAQLDARSEPCELAARVARTNGASLTSCRVGQEEAVVAAEVAFDGLLTRLGPATARAHAGPGRED